MTDITLTVFVHSFHFFLILQKFVVCAPEAGRSGFSCAFSVVDYLLLKKRNNIPNCEVWSCSGTPVDCVKLALDRILVDRKPDLILGGINHGDNSSVNNHYSGTMGIAYEGCMNISLLSLFQVVIMILMPTFLTYVIT